jgi:rhodanese-related sulfurtransferase
LAQKLREGGYQAYALQGGFDAWKAAGLQVEPKARAA